MTIGERIKERRIACGISQESLALSVGYKNRASITKIEKNAAEIPQSIVYKIAVALNTSPQYLMGWTDDARITETKPVKQPKADAIPLLGKASCGHGTSAAILVDIPCPAWIDADCAVQVSGESMASQNIHDGDIVYLKGGNVGNNKIGCVRIGDEYYLKIVERTDNFVMLRSDLPTIIIDGEQTDAEIIGRAVYKLQAI